MKAIIVLSFNFTAEEINEKLPEILEKIDPPRLPCFDGKARIAVQSSAEYVTSWLDDDSGEKDDGSQLAD